MNDSGVGDEVKTAVFSGSFCINAGYWNSSPFKGNWGQVKGNTTRLLRRYYKPGILTLWRW
jgi:hypothetical protein